jgi:hypothetical protein
MFRPTEAFSEIARGDQAAYDFLAAFYLWCHKHDDLIDRDKPVKPEENVWFNLNLFQQLARNPFYQKNHEFLWPVLVTSGLSWIASEDFKRKENVLEKITAQVLKSEYVNVILAIAFLVGGFEHALAMSRKYREYAFDDEKPQVQA